MITLALSLRGLSKTYATGFEALKRINLDVREGDFFALLGPNGAGKSTTIGIVSSLVRKSAGQVLIFDHDLDRQPDTAKRLIGIVPQEINFNQFETVEQIVINQAGYHGIPAREARKRTEACLRDLGLWSKRKAISRTLSGGMKRRLMIARALVHGPRLLILDEPTAGVDIESRRSMWDLLRRLNAEGTTIILTTHYLEEAETLCRTLAIIHQGRIIEHSSMANLLSRIDSSRYLLDLSTPPETIPALEGMRLERLDALTLSVEVPNALGVQLLFEKLAGSGLHVRGIRNAANRLEQFFLDLVMDAERPSPLEGRPSSDE